jgi:V/A-type H+-transporting ATPase subunit I
MTFIDINGEVDYLDEILRLCLDSGMFQPEYAAKLSEYSVGDNALLRNPYGALLVKINDMASQLKIAPAYRAYEKTEDDGDTYIEMTHDYLNDLRREYPGYFEKQRKIMDEITSYTTALEMLGHVNVSDINFDNIWDNEFLKIRFGRLPASNVPKLEIYEDKPYELYKLDENESHVWCLYFTAEEYKDDIDKMFFTLDFERLRVPDFVRGTPAEAMAAIRASLEDERTMLEAAGQEIEGFVQREQEKFLEAYSQVKFLHDAYDLRKYVVSIRDHFHLIGFVLARNKDAFIARLNHIEGLAIIAEPASKLERLPVPVKLRNNWFVKPFEMFVNMYGAPSYEDIDPTPFLAYTYTVLFGVMFGDLGHGLCVVLAGLLMWKKMGMQLGAIMTRIGISSMFVGFWYGSVFGFEHLLDPFFTNVLGLHEKPIEVLHPDTTTKILIVAIALGAVSIMAAIIFNMIIGLKQRNFERAILSSNGLCGLVFYASVLFGAIMMVSGNSVFTAPYVLGLIVLPMLVIFFREPITRYIQFVNKDTMISHDADLVENTLLDQKDANIPELFSSPFMTARFGRIPTDSYKKLSFYSNEPFMLYPVKTDQEYIWLIYATAIINKAEIDAIFHDLYFERIFIPEDDLRTTEDAKDFIKKCVEVGAPPQSAVPEKYAPVGPARRRTVYQRVFPDGFGAFFMETFFELFEVVLSFISNTMSFLRVGGFVLVHAGMMSVVMTLAQMVNSGGVSAIVIIIGNVFVMLIEGLIVGIQVLRLEFYEMFSRFYGENGDLFAPVSVQYS